MSKDPGIRVERFYCNCGFSNIQISFIERRKHSWFVRGFGTEYGTEYCPNCGAICRSIVSDLEIQCEPFSCPTCGEKEDLNFKINNIKTDNTSFEFEAEIICEKCNKNKSLKKIISSMLDIKKLKISPTGIEIEK